MQMPLSHDLRAGVRRIRQNPGFSFVAILTLALGIGANASIFTVINAILFRPLPAVERGSELVSLNEKLGGAALPFTGGSLCRCERREVEAAIAHVTEA